VLADQVHATGRSAAESLVTCCGIADCYIVGGGHGCLLGVLGVVVIAALL
jgi:hypothetical protein